MKRIRIRKSENLPSKRPDIMYIYDKQSGRIHRNHPKHSNPENRCFHYVRPQKSPKIAQKKRSLKCDLLNFFNRYGIFWVVPSESYCPDGSEYAWQRGVGGL